MFRQFYKVLLSHRIAHTEIPNEYENDREKYVGVINDFLNLEGQCRLTPDALKPNKAGASLLKNYSNILLGL